MFLYTCAYSQTNMSCLLFCKAQFWCGNIFAHTKCSHTVRTRWVASCSGTPISFQILFLNSVISSDFLVAASLPCRFEMLQALDYSSQMIVDPVCMGCRMPTSHDLLSTMEKISELWDTSKRLSIGRFCSHCFSYPMQTSAPAVELRCFFLSNLKAWL